MLSVTLMKLLCTLNLTELENQTKDGTLIPVYGFEREPYVVSTKGEFYSMRQGSPRLIESKPNSLGVLSVSLRSGSRWVPNVSAELVMLSFGMKKPSTLDFAIYKDDDLQNIDLSNLSWGGTKELSRIISLNRVKRNKLLEETVIEGTPSDHEFQSFFRRGTEPDEDFNCLLDAYLKLYFAAKPFADFEIPKQFNSINRDDPLFYLTDGFQLRYRDLFRMKSFLEDSSHEEIITRLRAK